MNMHQPVTIKLWCDCLRPVLHGDLNVPAAMAIPVRRYQQVSILNFIGAKDDGRDGDNWSCKMCKGPVKLSSSTNQHPAFYRPDALPVAKATASEHWREVSHSRHHRFVHCLRSIKAPVVYLDEVTKHLVSPLTSVTQCQRTEGNYYHWQPTTNKLI